MSKPKGSRSHSRVRMVLAIVFIITVSAAYVLGWSSLFTVKQVVVVGAPNPSETFAIEHAVKVGGKMARLEGQTIAKSLRKYTWLDHSSVSRNWLKGVVTVRVWTRTPVAQYQTHLVDAAGVVFDLPSVDASRLPTVDARTETSAKFGVSVLKALPVKMQSHVLGLIVHDSDSVDLSIKDPTLKRVITVVWGDETNMALKVQVYQALVALPENSAITIIDLSAPHAPIVK